MLLDLPPKLALRDFLWRCSKIRSIDISKVGSIATETIRYLKAKPSEREMLHEAQELEMRWYASLRTAGDPDWSVYEGDYYLGELWACWIVYSRKYLRDILNPKMGIIQQIGRARTRKVVDLGCGCGYTTAALCEMFPYANVIGTNFEGTRQSQIAQDLGKSWRFKLVSDTSKVGFSDADVVFASEYFEHIPAPIEHLRGILADLRPRVLFIANSFRARAIGHFDHYDVGSCTVSDREIGKWFSAELRAHGYEKQKTKLWNNRPEYWINTNG